MEDGDHKNEVSISKTALNPKRSSSVPERTGHISVLAEKYMIIWGGYNDEYNIPYNLHIVSFDSTYLPPDNLWIYDTEFKVWFVCKSRGVVPIAASGCTACSQEGCMYVFGGHSRVGYLNTLYKLDLNKLQWEIVSPVSHSPAPSPRDKAVSWFYDDKFYTFGGYGINNVSRDDMYLEECNARSFYPDETSEHGHKGWNNQLCIFNFKTMEWSLVEPKGQRPSARAAHSAVRLGRKVYIFGGRHQNLRLNDLHSLDLDTQTWSGCLHVSSEQPEGRSWHTASAVSSTQMFLYGGFSSDCVPLSDAWVLDTVSLQWTQLSHFPTNQPRLWHSACVTQEKEVIVFGGCDNNILDEEEESEVNHRNDILLFQLQPYSLTRLCTEYVYRHKMQFGGHWDLLPRQFCDWLNRREELNIQLLMSSDSSSDSDSDNDSTQRSSGQTCVVS